jgi:predicted ATPase
MAYLRSRRTLLVLDNCEQLRDQLAWLSALLAQAPGLKLLATSREPLHLPEEWVLPVPALIDSQAAELFEQAARRAGAGFAAASQQAAVGEICRLVENLPLAIELAAGWTPFMSCAQIAEHIRRDLDFLSAPGRQVHTNHRRAAALQLATSQRRNALAFDERSNNLRVQPSRFRPERKCHRRVQFQCIAFGLRSIELAGS